MELFITHKSALEYWCLHDMTEAALEYRQRQRRAPESLPYSSSMDQTYTLGLSLPIDATVADKEAMRISKMVKSHMFSGVFPEGCFVRVGDGLYVASPEFCFLQMAEAMPLVKLVELGFELCGSYAISRIARNAATQATAEGPTDKGFLSRKPRTNIKKLSAFIERMAGASGQRPASRALQYISDGSASPMETKLTMFLTLPYRFGGYGLPMPELNTEIDPSKKAKQGSSQTAFFCDLFWPEANVVAEYDSEMFHEGAKRITKDSKRRNTLMSTGLLVITVTKDQIYNIIEFEKLAKLIAINLDIRLRNQENRNFPKARFELRKLLL